MLKGSDADLGGAVDIRIADPLVVHFELIDTIDVRDLEFGHILVALLFENGSDKWIDSDELQLNIVGFEWKPLSVGVPLDLNRVNHVLHNGVGFGGRCLAHFMVIDATDAKYSLFFKYPFGERQSQCLIA